MGGGAREEHVRSDGMPLPPIDSDATDVALLGNCSLNSASFESGFNENARNPDSNPTLDDNEDVLQGDIESQNWSEMCHTMRRTATLFAEEYRAKLMKRQVQSDGSSSSSKAGVEDHPPDQADESLDTVSLMNQIGTNMLLKKFHDLNLEGDVKSVSEDERGETLLSLVNEIKDLERQVKDRKEWAHQKAIQAARKLCHDLTELKMLRVEKEEYQRILQWKPTAEDPAMKRLSEIETALWNANGEEDRADIGVRIREALNGDMRAEIKALKLSASESVAMCLEVAKREKKQLKKLLDWENQRARLHEGITLEKQKLVDLQEEILQVEAAKKTAEAKWREERRSKEHALAQAEEERRLKEATKANKKRNHETLRSKIKLDFQRFKDDLQRLEQELSRIKTITNPEHSTSMSASGSHPQDETFAKLLHESDDLDENEERIDRECIFCSEDEASVVFLPCGHQVLCASCNEMFGKKGITKCPTCRVPIERRICVFGTSS